MDINEDIKKELTKKAEIEHEETPENPDIFSAEKDIIKGKFIGDKSVRIRRPVMKGIKKVEQGTYEITAPVKSKSFLGRIINKAMLFLIGKPLRTADEVHERLTKIKGLAVFASDCISSSAYAPEEILRALMLAGTGALFLNLPISVAILILLAIVTTSYQQTINAYPRGGGSYIVAKDNLGTIAGLFAASAVLIDYILTVAVSISAGIYAIVSVYPGLVPEKVLLCVMAIIILTLANLRGIKESGTLFALPVYIYIFTILGVLGYGVVNYFLGAYPEVVLPQNNITHSPDGIAHTIGFFLILRAFSSGASGLTGVEAVADGVAAFKPPESKNARITLIWMAVIFGLIFFSISFLANKLGIVPDHNELKSVITLVVEKINVHPFFEHLVAFATMAILILAANTSFADFPRLSYFLARDKFLPSHFGFRGDRLAFNNGIIFLAMVACILVIHFKASVSGLIPLYTIGVFIAFTLSQAGMVMHWWKTRNPGWRISMPVNAVGACITLIVLLVVAVTKFTEGAWVVIILIPIIIMLFLSIKKHYGKVSREISLISENENELLNESDLINYIVIPISDITKASLKAVNFINTLAGPKHKKVIIDAVHITDDVEEGHKLQERWAKLKTGIPLRLIESPYRRLIRPLIHYIDAIERKYKQKNILITVIVPEVVSDKWWQLLYRTNTAFLLKSALLFHRRTIVLSFPYHLTDDK